MSEPWRGSKVHVPARMNPTPDAVPDAALAELPEAITSSSIRSKRTKHDMGHWPDHARLAGARFPLGFDPFLPVKGVGGTQNF